MWCLFSIGIVLMGLRYGLHTMYCQGTRLVAITGWGQSADKARAQKAGFDRHLTKPVDYDELAAILHGESIRAA